MTGSSEDSIKPLKVSVTFQGAPATEIRRVCHNLNIENSLFVRIAVEEKLGRMGIRVK